MLTHLTSFVELHYLTGTDGLLRQNVCALYGVVLVKQ